MTAGEGQETEFALWLTLYCEKAHQEGLAHAQIALKLAEELERQVFAVYLDQLEQDQRGEHE